MHILLIEDHPYYRQQVASILQKKLEVVKTIRTAISVGEAIEQIEADHPLDFVLTDTQIKHGSCIDVFCGVTKYDYNVVFMSSDERDYRVKRMIKAGFPFYYKGDSAEKLISLIQANKSIATRPLTKERITELKRIMEPEQNIQSKRESGSNWLQSLLSFIKIKRHSS